FASATSALSIAEGVETEAELRELRALGVDLAQGYLLGRPAPPWPSLTSQARAVIAPPGPAPVTEDPAGLVAALAAAASPADACERVSEFLAHHSGLLPSVYLERGGVLRCQSRRGQWLVMDGLHPRTGITGAAFAEEAEILSADVRVDPRYRLAIPGVLSEMAVPLRVRHRTVGVLNVDALAPLLPAHIDLIRQCAHLLETRLESLDKAGAWYSTLRDLSRLAPTVAQAGSADDLCRATLDAVAELTGFDGGCLWTFDGELPRVAGTVGTASGALTSLDDAHVLELRELVSELASCYSGGTDLSLAVPPTHVLRERGVRGVVLVPIRDGWRLTDLLALSSATTSFVSADVVDAVESLCLQTGSRLASLRRVAELEALVHRDPLTGVGNRGLWNVVLQDAAPPRPDGHGRFGGEPFAARAPSAPGSTFDPDAVWLAVADVDRFKQVNDTRGHVTGDEVLCALASLFSTLPGWSVFRLGGDEFTMFGPAGTTPWPHELAAVSTRARGLLAPFGASVSIGAVRTTRDRLTSAVEVADRALYRRKRAGGDGLTLDRTSMLPTTAPCR
ncbi:MAG TPA: diguanylate cyclase, partial [Cellulomonadaceae bacterium]|nr:diguanylate cyclase [Cellulomonadaceae bacterium]